LDPWFGDEFPSGSGAMPDETLITGETRVGELLRDHPEVEEVLIGMAPAFEKLRNPVLRRGVGRVATLKQAAAVGRIPVVAMVNELRVAAGQVPLEDAGGEETSYFESRPAWFSQERVIEVVREDEIDPNMMPIRPLLRRARKLGSDDILEFVSSHLPAPGIDILRKKGYRTWSVEDEPLIRTYVAGRHRTKAP
jgi:hypothetical protein